MIFLKIFLFLLTLNIVITFLNKCCRLRNNAPPPEEKASTTAYQSILGYLFIPNINVSLAHERGHYMVTTNSDTLRSDRDYSFNKPQGGIYRILVFGDSFSAADSVNNAERYTDLLASKINDVEIINFAVPGFGTDQQLLMFKEKGLKYDFDLVLVCPLLENIRRNVARYRLAIEQKSGAFILVAKPYFILKDDLLLLRNVPVPLERILLERATREMLSHTDFGGFKETYGVRNLINRYFFWLKPFLVKIAGWKAHPEYYKSTSYGWRLMARLLREFKNLTPRKPVVICPLPYYIQIEGLEGWRVYSERFKSLDNHVDMRVVDIFSYFKQLSPAEKRQCRWEYDIHYTPFAHKVIADALYRELKQLDILPSRHFRE